MKRLAVVISAFTCMLFSSLSVIAQTSDPGQLFDIGTGQNPPGIDWKEIKSPHFRIIYPSDIEKDAQRVANLLEHVYPHVCKTLNYQPKSIPIILHTRYAESNGFVTPFPRRSEWYNTPAQSGFSGTNEWYAELAIHEYRHVVQFDHTRRGFNGFLYWPFGELGQMAGAFFALPMWYFEGDATLTETLLTDSGRGRLPAFDAELRALLLAGKRYDYYKAMFGSYRDWDPLSSPYLLGYFMTAHIRREYGDNLEKSFNATMLMPLMPQLFSIMLWKNTGRGASRLYDAAMNELTFMYQDQVRGLKITPATPLHGMKSRLWTYNRGADYLPDGRIVVNRLGMDDVNSIVLIDPVAATEKIIARPGMIDLWLSAGGDVVVWAEGRPALRWGLVSYSEIHALNLATGKCRRLTKRSRYGVPVISADGSRIAAVEFTTDNRSYVVILDAATGAEIKRIEAPAKEAFITPRFLPDGKSLVCCTIHHTKGKSLALLDIRTGALRYVLPHSHENISTPLSDGRYAYYVSSYSGIDNVYATDLATGKTFQVSSRSVGAYDPALSKDGKRLAFSDMTPEGTQVVEMVLNPKNWTPLEDVRVRKIGYAEPLVKSEAGGSILKDLPNNTYPAKKYSGIADLITLHSWAPVPNPLSREFSFTMYARNLLATFQGSAGYFYNWNENTHGCRGAVSYNGLFPLITIDGTYAGRSVMTVYESRDNTIKEKVYSWMESSGGITIALPFNISRGIYIRTLTLKADSRYVDISDANLRYRRDSGANGGGFIPLGYSVEFFNGYTWFGDILPRLGQSLVVSYTHTPFEGDYKGSIASADLMLFFPGIVRNHHLFFEASYEQQWKDNYPFLSRVLFARGYAAIYADRLVKGSANYTFPLWHPDYNLWHVLHFKRFILNPFFDYGLAWIDEEMIHYRSTGLELSAQIFFFTVTVPIRIGTRFSYPFDAEKKGLVVEPFFAIEAAF